MSAIAIKVENLSKRYVLSHQRAGGDGLRHVLQEKLTAPLRWLRGKIRGQKSEASSPTSDLRPPTSAASPPTSEEFWALKDVSFSKSLVTGFSIWNSDRFRRTRHTSTTCSQSPQSEALCVPSSGPPSVERHPIPPVEQCLSRS